MSDKTYPVIFNDDYSHDGVFKREQYAELTQEQYDCAKKLSCGYDASRPLITDAEKQGVKPVEKKETPKP